MITQDILEKAIYEHGYVHVVGYYKSKNGDVELRWCQPSKFSQWVRKKILKDEYISLEKK